MGDMSRNSLVSDLKASMPGSEVVLNAANDADYERLLDAAALDFARVRPRTLIGEITLQADVSEYPAPADIKAIKFPLWGVQEKRARRPWQSNYPGRLPRPYLVEVAGVRQISLDPAPTAEQITDLGATYRFYYFAVHSISDQAADTTVDAADRGLLLLRAQAEAMKELAARNIHKPTQMRDGMNATPRNGTPAALHDQLMRSFEGQAR